MAANEERGEVEIRLDRVRTLRFLNKSLAKLRGALGMSHTEFLWRLQGDEEGRREVEKLRQQEKPLTQELLMRHGIGVIHLDELIALLWAGLLHEDPKLELDDVADLMEYAEGDAQAQKEAYVTQHVMKALFLRVAPQHARAVENALSELPQQMTSTPSGESSDASSAGTDSRPTNSGS